MRKLLGLIFALQIVTLATGCQYGSFFVEVQSNELIVTHSDYLFDCDLDVKVDVTTNGNIIDIGELYDGAPAKCSCFYDTEVRIKDLAPGDYLVRIWMDNFDEIMFTTVVTVADTMAQLPGIGPEILYNSESSGCVD